MWNEVLGTACYDGPNDLKGLNDLNDLKEQNNLTPEKAYLCGATLTR